MPELNKEDIERMKAELDASFAAHEISQEDYDSRMANVEFVLTLIKGAKNED